jgi:hypothetical protein
MKGTDMTHTLTLTRGAILAGTANFTQNPDGTIDVWEVSFNTDGGMGGKFTIDKARKYYRRLLKDGWKPAK